MKIIPSKMQFQVVEMDRETAQHLLDKNHPKNRRLKETRVAQYQSDMTAGFWSLTWEPIVQDEDGYTVEGQNRLTAFLRSEMETLPCVFVSKAPRKAMLGAGCGTPRSVIDVARITGQEFPHGGNNYGAIARRMAIGLEAHKNTLSIPETLQFAKKHRDAIEFAFEAFGTFSKRGITVAGVVAVVARAYYRRNCRNRIRQFCVILLDGLPEHRIKDSAAIRLRNVLLDNIGGRRRREGSRISPKVIYAKTEVALSHFIDETEVQLLKETREELFPIPDDPSLEDTDEQVAGKVG